MQSNIALNTMQSQLNDTINDFGGRVMGKVVKIKGQNAQDKKKGQERVERLRRELSNSPTRRRDDDETDDPLKNVKHHTVEMSGIKGELTRQDLNGD